MAIVCKCQSQEGTHYLYRETAVAFTVLHCSRALTGLVTKGFVIALPTFHAFFITHWCRLPQHGWIARFPLLGRVCAYHYYTECAHSIGIRVNRREERLINLSPRRLESGHVRFFFARLLDTSAESQNLPGLELSTYLEGFLPPPFIERKLTHHH